MRAAGMSVQLPVWTAHRFIGVRVGRRYFKLRDLRCHPKLFSERNGYGYRRIVRAGHWEFGVRTSSENSTWRWWDPRDPAPPPGSGR